MKRAQAEALIRAAAEARAFARVPLSGFRVGAALLTDGGEIITGCNVELGNMYESICAERCALVKAVSSGYTRFCAIAVVSDASFPLPPCGFCRHSLIDFGRELQVICSNAEMTEAVVMTAEELMPAYDLEHASGKKPIGEIFED